MLMLVIGWLDRVVGDEGAGDGGDWSWYSCAGRHAAPTQQRRPWGGRVRACCWSSRSTTQSHWVRPGDCNSVKRFCVV